MACIIARSNIFIKVLTLEVNSANINLERIWNSVNWRKIEMQQLIVCFINAGTESHLFDAEAAVLNFAPVPATVHMFGGTIAQRKATLAKKKVRSRV